MVQTRSGQASTASESKPRITHVKASKKAGTDDAERENIKKPVNEGEKDTAAETVPEKRKRDDEPDKDVTHDQDQAEPPTKEGQPPPSKTVKESEEDTTGARAGDAGHEGKGGKVPSAIAHKIHKTIDEYGSQPLEGLGVDKPLEPTPEVLLALVIDSMLKSTRISHLLAQKTSIAVFKAGYHDINVLSNTTWEERVQVLSDGGYNRYRETTATKLGDLAQLVNEKYGSLHSHIQVRDRSADTLSQMAISTTY